MRRIGAVTAIASAAAVAGVDPSSAADFDPEKLLWIPGAKKIIDLHSPAAVQVDQATLDVAVEQLVPQAARGLPRYALTTPQGGTALFNDKWQLLNPQDLVKRGLSERDVVKFARDMADPQATGRIMLTGERYFGHTTVDRAEYVANPRLNLRHRVWPDGDR